MEIAIKSIKGLDDLKVVLEYYGCNFKLTNGQYKSNCIFHQEKTASLYLSMKNGQAFYKCFGCNQQGDIINVIQIKEGLSTIEAVKKAYEILGRQYLLKPSKIDKLINYIETNKFYKIDGYRIEKVYVYMVDEDKPSFLKVKYRNLTDTSIKDLRTYKVIDAGEYYKTATKAKGGEYEHTIYNYPKVKKAIEKGNNIYFVEGEKDVDNLQKLGLTATTIYTKTWKEVYSKQLEGAKIVFIGDTGEAGESFKQLVYKNLNNIVPSFKVIDLPGIEDLGDNKDISDWLEVDGNDKAKLIDAIKNGWDLKISDKWIDVDIKTTKDKVIVTPKKTLRNFELMLKRANTSIFFNEVSKLLEIKTDKFDNKNLNTFATEVYSYCQTEGLKLNQNEVLKFIDAVGYKMQINPFKSYLDSLKDKWDGKSRLNDFYNIFTTPEYFDDELKEIILKKWLLQFIGSAYDTNFKSPGLVVMKGRQGLGKTSIFKNLIPIDEDWTFLEEQHFTGDRDNIQTITSNQLVEFSEFARSNKAVDALKAFITSPTDKMVLKYDKHPVQYKRRTVYYATVNDSEFLLDDENRRFWVIELIDIDLNHNVDFNQLWAEMYHIYHNQNIKNYWLSQQEQEIIEKNNQNYKFKGELETLIDNSFDFMYNKRIWLTSSEVAQIVGGKHGSTKITRCLKSMGIEQKNINNKDIPRGRYNSMPIPVMWGKDIPHRYVKRIVSPLSEVKNLDEKDKLLQDQQEEIKNLKQHIRYLENKLSEVYTQLEII